MFWLTSIVAIAATLMAISRLNATHALLYLIVSFLSVAVIFLQLGAPFVAAIEIIVYAGAIMVLFVFVIMLLNMGPQAVEGERQILQAGAWVGPSFLAAVLFVELLIPLTGNGQVEGEVSQAQVQTEEVKVVGPKEVGMSLFGPYLLGVELAGFLLLAGLVGAFHIGREDPRESGVHHESKESPPEGQA
jgi:NADH-quinone oxidoreductase subunit J